MTVVEPVAPSRFGMSSLSWSAIIAGAIAAAALAFILHAFAAAIGLAVSSPSPTWRDASFALVFLSGLYLILAALASYAFGAFVAARVRAPIVDTGDDDAEFRDGMHGLLTWALATLITGFLALMAAQSLPRLAAPAGNAGTSTSVAGENLIAFDLDRLFRGERRPQGDVEGLRSEAARILLTVSSHDGLQADDRAHLVRLVALTTGLTPADAERRVSDVSVRAKANIDRARRSAVLLAFMAGAAALLGAAAAWFAAVAAGAYRDRRVATPAMLDWGRGSSVRRSVAEIP